MIAPPNDSLPPWALWLLALFGAAVGALAVRGWRCWHFSTDDTRADQAPDFYSERNR